MTLARRAFVACLFALLLTSVARAQTETWVHATPSRVIPDKLSVYTCDGLTGVSVHWVFADAGYRVVQQPEVTRSGQTVSLDVRAEEWTGGRTLAIVPFEKSFDLGMLEPGDYTLVVKSWGATLRQTQFTVRQTAPSARAIDGACFFVTQHYRDFLSRQPDGSGFSFWTDEINRCGADTACVETKRVNVSAAFFLSIEFRNTGYFVYRVYRAALGRPPTLAEFAPDAAQVGARVVVAPDSPWNIQLNGNKDAYAQAFTARPEFVARYNGLTTAQYVDKLFETAGVNATKAERDELVASVDNCTFTIGCPTRATLLRRVAEHPALDAKVFEEAFVTMQYFGYLRRDPDAEGLQFWLSKLRRFNGNYVAAEMVKAFINSDEYRNRF